jgi:hypothetical protein
VSFEFGTTDKARFEQKQCANIVETNLSSTDTVHLIVGLIQSETPTVLTKIHKASWVIPISDNGLGDGTWMTVLDYEKPDPQTP